MLHWELTTKINFWHHGSYYHRHRVEGIALAVLGRANFLLLLTVIATSVTLSDDLISSQTCWLFLGITRVERQAHVFNLLNEWVANAPYAYAGWFWKSVYCSACLEGNSTHSCFSVLSSCIWLQLLFLPWIFFVMSLPNQGGHIMSRLLTLYQNLVNVICFAVIN